MRKVLITLFIFIILIFNLTSCFDDKLAGHFGVSENIIISKSEKFYEATYVPNKFNFVLLDSSIIKIDTAWAESMWAYDKNSKPILADEFGYNFIIPIKKQELDKFIFTFKIADTSNQSITGGLEATRCALSIKELLDTINIILEQKNPDTTYGWIKPITTDTIVFIKKQ